MHMTNTDHAPTDCSRCGGSGWLAARGYRFYSNNGRVCPCGRFADANEAGWFFQAEREAESNRLAEEKYAAQKAARAARRAARRAAEA